MEKVNSIRVEARYNNGELIKAAIVKDNKGVIAFIKENAGNYKCSYKYRKFIVKHINTHDYIMSLKRK